MVYHSFDESALLVLGGDFSIALYVVYCRVLQCA